MALTLYDKLWNSHVVDTGDDGTTLLYIDRHLVHEVTSPQAFEGLKLAGRKPWRLSANLAVADHNVPTTDRANGIADPVSRLQVETLAVAIFEPADVLAAHRILDFADARNGRVEARALVEIADQQGNVVESKLHVSLVRASCPSWFDRLAMRARGGTAAGSGMGAGRTTGTSS